MSETMLLEENRMRASISFPRKQGTKKFAAFFPGFRFSTQSTLFSELEKEAHANGFAVIKMDFDEKSAPIAYETKLAFAQAAYRLVFEQHGPEQIIGIGHSYGGVIATGLTHRFGPAAPFVALSTAFSRQNHLESLGRFRKVVRKPALEVPIPTANEGGAYLPPAGVTGVFLYHGHDRVSGLNKEEALEQNAIRIASGAEQQAKAKKGKVKTYVLGWTAIPARRLTFPAANLANHNFEDAAQARELAKLVFKLGFD